jgi:hypothetical protein
VRLLLLLEAKAYVRRIASRGMRVMAECDRRSSSLGRHGFVTRLLPRRTVYSIM